MAYFFRAISCALAGCALLAMAGLASAEDKPAENKDDQRNLIAGLCSTQLDLDAAGCACVADRALTELNDDQRAYLVLSVVQPDAAQKMPIANSKDELAAVFNFLSAAHDACAKSNPPAPAQGGDTGAAQPAPQ